MRAFAVSIHDFVILGLLYIPSQSRKASYTSEFFDKCLKCKKLKFFKFISLKYLQLFSKLRSKKVAQNGGYTKLKRFLM